MLQVAFLDRNDFCSVPVEQMSVSLLILEKTPVVKIFLIKFQHGLLLSIFARTLKQRRNAVFPETNNQSQSRFGLKRVNRPVTSLMPTSLCKAMGARIGITPN